jgi:hypothetical protein
MRLALVITLLAGQTFFEWVDSRGQSHFTDDPRTIPAGAKRRETKGDEVMVSPAAGVKTVDAGAAAPRVEVDTCALARQQLVAAEQRGEQAKSDARRMQEQASQKCQQVLLTHGQGEFARCMASRAEVVEPDQASQVQLETLRETLRRAQQSGCR